MTSPENPRLPQILVVDDEPSARTALCELLRDEGYEVHAAADGFKALGRTEQWEPDLVITDVKMPALGGIELMAKLRERFPEVAVIVMTAFGCVEGAVEAMQLGADDYLGKPVNLPHLLMVVKRVLAHRALQREARQLRTALADRERDGAAGMIGDSRPFREVLELARQVAEAPVPVLLHGELGTGKQTLARQIHQWSGRPGKLVSVRCGVLGEHSVAHELFGAQGDAGPQREGRSHEGRLYEARGGTLLLLGIDEASLEVQAQLLRVVQARQSGAPGEEGWNVRIIATTGRELAAEVKAGRFRQDLYYQLNVINLRVPSLRERQEDIALLAEHQLRRMVRDGRKPIVGFHERTIGMLRSFDWPGNIRQLENCIERAVLIARGAEIEPRDLPRELLTRTRGGEASPVIPGTSLHEIERFAILQTLEHVGGSTSKAAKILGISPRKIQYRLNEYRAASTGSVAAER